MKALAGFRLRFLFVVIFGISLNLSAQTVYITKTGAKYHKSDCRYLSKSKISIDFSKAKDLGYSPCSVCKPNSKSTGQQTNTKSTTTTKSVTTTTNSPANLRCAAVTQSGTRCKRNAESGSKYCWQHKK